MNSCHHCLDTPEKLKGKFFKLIISLWLNNTIIFFVSITLFISLFSPLIVKMSINDEIDHFLFKSKMTTMAPLEKVSDELSTNSIAAIIVGVLIALIIIGVTTAYICKKYAEVSILFL